MDEESVIFGYIYLRDRWDNIRLVTSQLWKNPTDTEISTRLMRLYSDINTRVRNYSRIVESVFPGGENSPQYDAMLRRRMQRFKLLADCSLQAQGLFLDDITRCAASDDVEDWWDKRMRTQYDEMCLIYFMKKQEVQEADEQLDTLQNRLRRMHLAMHNLPRAFDGLPPEVLGRIVHFVDPHRFREGKSYRIISSLRRSL